MIRPLTHLKVEASTLRRLLPRAKAKERQAKAVAAARGARAPGVKAGAKYQHLLSGLFSQEGHGILGVPASGPAPAQSGQEGQQLHPQLSPGCKPQLHPRGQAPQRRQPQRRQPQFLRGLVLLRRSGRLPEDSPLWLPRARRSLQNLHQLPLFRPPCRLQTSLSLSLTSALL